MEIFEADLIQAMRWHEGQAQGNGAEIEGVLPLAVAALADALYSIWGTDKRLDMSILSRKAVQSLNDYWQGEGIALKIDTEQYPIEIDDFL